MYIIYLKKKKKKKERKERRKARDGYMREPLNLSEFNMN